MLKRITTAISCIIWEICWIVCVFVVQVMPHVYVFIYIFTGDGWRFRLQSILWNGARTCENYAQTCRPLSKSSSSTALHCIMRSHYSKWLPSPHQRRKKKTRTRHGILNSQFSRISGSLGLFSRRLVLCDFLFQLSPRVTVTYEGLGRSRDKLHTFRQHSISNTTRPLQLYVDILMLIHIYLKIFIQYILFFEHGYSNSPEHVCC